jgi:Ca-activated chloride channel family protein
VLEVVYTFPLPAQAVLLGFASELNGARQVGSVFAKAQAEDRYEEALDGGDAPVLLEALDDGLHTANIGNLKPGDEIVLEVRYAQLLAFEQGRLRLAIPTTLAPRYGNPVAAGLQPQQVPEVSLEAEYPLALALTIAGTLAGGRVECPTHRFTRTSTAEGLRLDLEPGARLDRDVVVVVEPREPMPSLAMRGHDSLAAAPATVVLAALQLPPAAQREAVALKLLVDCSGSMGGDSIASARRALNGLLSRLGVADAASLTRFGSTVQHVLQPTACDPESLRRLRLAMESIDADLGGTEMEAALRAVVQLATPAPHPTADILLVTDGEVWQVDPLIAHARACGHRIFVIGVGASPSEGVLRRLAEATGGACEFATPGEALEAAAQRMLARIRQRPWTDLRIDWGFEPAWQVPLPACAFGQETLVAMAGAASGANTNLAVRLRGSEPGGAPRDLARVEADAPCASDALARIVAHRRLASVPEAEHLPMAVRYQLMTRQTGCVLVHERAASEQPQEPAQLLRVRGMLAAGWGASGSVMLSGIAPRMAAAATPGGGFFAAFHESFSSLSAPLPGAYHASYAITDRAAPDASHLLTVLEAVARHHLKAGPGPGGLRGAADARVIIEPGVTVALDEVARLGLSDDECVLALVDWWVRRKGRAPWAPLGKLVESLDAVKRAAADAVFDRLLGHVDPPQRASRAERLRRALTSPTR